MNKIFKVVWSKSKNCYVVVSEFAKNNSGKKKIVVAAILAALAMTNASISMAANTLPTNLHATAVGLGDGASVTGDKAVGFGQNAAAAGGYSIAIGSNSSTSVNSPQGIAIGGGNTANEGARVIGEQAIAIGGNTIAQGNSSIVIGGDDVVKADGVKVIYTTNNGENKTGDLRSAVQSLTGFDMRNPLYTSATAGESGITLGMKGQSGNVGIAIGTGANAKDRLSGTSSGASGQANNDVTNAIAIGTGARANRDNAIAIGGGSNTDVGGTKQSSYTLPNNVVASWAGGDKTLPGDVVSFGSKGYERQLKHVAPGEVSSTSTDAINGSQLSAIVDQITYKYISIKSSDVANKDNTGATAANSIAIGPNAATDASASRSVAVGDGARGKVVDGVAVGSKSTADIASGVAGYNVNASRTDIYAGLSGATLTSKLGGVAIGTTNQTRQINYVAAGTADTDAVNVAQLKSVNLAFTGDTGTGDVNLANSKLAVNGDNTYITTTANGKKITVSGKKQDITVANGSATASAGMADSANVANAINQAIDQNKYGWNLSANGEATPLAVEKGNTVDFSGDDNVAVARNDKKISVALKKDLSKLNSASFNNAGGNETVKIDGDKGINAGNLKVTNVADGVADKDAVNVSQLKKVDNKAEANKTAIDTNKTAITKNAGDIVTNKSDIATNKDNIATNKQKIADNKTAIDKNTGEIATNKGDIASNKANIAQNTAAIARKISLGGNSGSTDEKSLSTGDVKFNVKGENGLTTVANGDDVTVKLDDTTKGKIENAADRDLSNLTPDGKQQVKELAAWNVVANNETAEKVEGGNTVKFIDGDNISITQNGKDFTISTKKDVTFDTVTATQTITAPKVKATTGVETPQVTGLTNTAWVPGQTQPVSGRAATEDQLKHVDDQVAENKANIVDNTDKIGKNAVAIADNKQKIADNKTAIDKNAGDIATNKDNIAANKQNIADNKAAITKNASDIATNKDNIDKNTTAIARKISLGGNSGSTDEKSLSTGDVKFNVKGENGLTTVANGDDVTVKLDDATKGKVDNAADRDLSNLTDAGKQQVKDLAVWHVVANNETAEKVEGGNTVKFIDGDNISITQNGKDFTISTKKDVTFDTVTATQTITAPKVKATTGVETPQVTGLTNTEWTPGQTQPVSGRAATEDQLKYVDDQVAKNKATIADNTDKIGKNADAIADNKQKIADNKTAIDKNAADITTNKDNIADNKQKIADNKTAIDKNTGDIATNKADISTNKDNIAINKANIDKNTTAIGRKISLGGNSGSTNEKSLSTGDVKFNVKGENGLTTVANGDDVTVKLDDATKGKVDNAADRDLSNLTPDGKQQVKDLAAWNVVANNEMAEKVEGGNTVKFIDGDNISITQNGKDFTISTKKDVTFDTVTAIQTITAPKVKATTGVETPQVTGLTNTAWTLGQTQPVSGRAATEDQLKYVDDQVAENKANIADNTDKIGKNADAIADNKQKIADNKTAIDKNAVDIATNKDNIAANKTDIATNKDNIATNKANIDKNTTAIGRKISLGGNSGSTDEKSLSTGDVKFNVKGENGLTTVANGDDVTVKLDDTTKGKIENAADQDLSNLTPDGKQQVKDLSAWNVVANDNTAQRVEGGNTVKFIDGDNISITQNGKDFTISTKKDVTFDTVTATQTITAPKVKAITGVETPQVTGLTNTAWTPGQTQPVSGRAATEDQLKHIDDQVAENKATIADNTDKIGKNAHAIADNKQKIADNKAAIDKNAVDIATNKDNIAANKTDIATNKDNIADNKQKIADNKTAITKNTDNIATNRQNIADNKAAITKNASDIVTNKDNIATNKANIDKNTTAIGRKISLGGNSGSTDEKSLSTGDVKFNVKGENGLTTVANGDDVTVKLDDATKGKVDNAADRDLSNLTDAGKQQVKDLAAWHVVANNEMAEKVEGGNTVKFIDGDNISITQNGKDFTISTKKDVTFDTVTAIQTITAPKVKATTGVETPQVTGLTNTAWVPGQTQPVSGRAATEDQLKHVDDQVAENKAKIADNTDKIGKNAEAIADNKQKIADNKAAIDKNAVDIATNKDNIATNKADIATNKADIATNKDNIATNKQNIADNKAAITKNAGDIAANKANIDKNTEAIGRKISLGGNTGSTDEKSLSTGDVKFNIKGQNGIVTEANGDDVTVKLDDATANKINNAANTDLSNLTDAGKQQVKDLSAWNVVANGNTAEKVEGGNTVKFIDGDNISITQNGKDFTIATKQDVTFNTVKANQTITAPKVKATEGVETPQVTGLTNTAWTPGQTQPVSGRAATEDQLKHVDDQVAENKANIADNTDKIGKNADAIADNKQKIANNKAAIDRNAADIATNKDNIAANKQNIADNKAAIIKNTSDIATNKDNIATNKANIDKNTTAIARKISLGGNSGLTDEKSLSTGDVKFNIKGENGLTTIANGEDVTVKIDDQTKAKIDNAANQDLSNLTETGKQQVKDISAWNVTAAGGTVEKVQGSDTVKFQAGDNLVVNQDRTTFTYGLAKDLKGLNSVTVGDENGVSTKITPAGTTVKDAAGNSTTINGGGMTITPADTAASPVSLTVDGLNNGGNKIHGVAPGTADTDAVNVSQLKASNAGLQEAVNRVGTETQRVGAHAAAMAALKPIQYDPLEPTQIMASIGNYRGETAGAIGIAHYRTEDTMFNVGVSLGTSHNMVNAGVTHKFGGSRERKDAIPERYKAGPISSVYVMQDEVSSLKKENSNQKTVIANQAARLNTLEAENERQRQELAETKQGLDDLRAVVNQLLASKG